MAKLTACRECKHQDSYRLCGKGIRVRVFEPWSGEWSPHEMAVTNPIYINTDGHCKFFEQKEEE